MRSAALFIASNTGGGPLAVSLSGTGTVAGLAPNVRAKVDSPGYSPEIAPGSEPRKVLGALPLD